MTKSKKIQVPVSPKDEQAIRAAAKLYKISAAEWMRRVALKAAQSDLALGKKVSPDEALEEIFRMELPVDDLESMTDEGIAGRLK